MMLDASKSQLLIIDVQERLLPAMHDPVAVEKSCALLLQAASVLNIPVTISEQYVKGLGGTSPTLKAHSGAADILEKIHFSCMRDDTIASHLEKLKQAGRSQIVLGGIEAHVCVLQTALDLLQKDFEVFMVSDAVNSRKQQSQHLAETRAAQAGGIITSCEMVIFEWLEKAGTPEFKTLSKLIK